ncbi:hypothetical protein [Enterobacter soli]|uniref:hypothetical protein n=1 Tax=Enterobacter soli TaxID=885040 RepID=UPI004046B294
MMLVTKVRQSMKSIIGAAKNLKQSRSNDIFAEVGFDFNLELLSFSDNRQLGNFRIQYVISPNPSTSSTAPSYTYDEILSVFESNISKVFKDNGLVLINYVYEQSDVVTDPTTGTVSLAFSINIRVTEKTN